MKNTKKQLETVHYPCVQGPRFKRPATNPRLNYSPSASSSPSPSLSIFTQQSAVLPETEWTAQKASSSKKLADASASNDRPNTEIRFILSFLWSVPFSFRRLGQRLTSFHGLYLSSRIISFVSLLRQPNDHFESAVYHTRGGGRGEEAQFNRGNRAIFPAIVPSFLPLAPRSKTLNPIDRIANEVELFLHPRGAISRNFTIGFRGSFANVARFSDGFWLVFTLLIFFWEGVVEEGERKREFRFVSLMNHDVKLIFVVFFSFFFLPLILTIRVIILMDVDRKWFVIEIAIALIWIYRSNFVDCDFAKEMKQMINPVFQNYTILEIFANGTME